MPGISAKERIPHDRLEGGKAKLPLPDVLVAVPVRPKGRLGVVQMHHHETIETASGIETRQCLLETCGRSQIEPGGEDVSSVETQPDARVRTSHADHGAKLLEVHAHRAAGAGGVLEQDAHRRLLTLFERPQESDPHPFETCLEAAALMGPDVGDDRVGAELLRRRHGAQQ